MEETKKKKINISKEDFVKKGLTVVSVAIFGTVCVKLGMNYSNALTTEGLKKMFKVNPKLEGDMWEAIINVKRLGL